jgi:HlyD family secretion protein
MDMGTPFVPRSEVVKMAAAVILDWSSPKSVCFQKLDEIGIFMAALPVKVSDALATRRRPPVGAERAGGASVPSAQPGLPYASPASGPDKPRLRGVALTGNILIGVFLLGLGSWSVFAPLRSAAVASGVVEPESSRKTIQHLEGGIVRDILVKNGEQVSAGQVLIKLDDIKPRAEFDSIRGQLWDAEASRARLVTEQQNGDRIDFPPALLILARKDVSLGAILAGQQKIFEARRQVMLSEIAITHEKMKQVQQEIAGLTAQQGALTARAEIVRQQLDVFGPLVKKGLERKTNLLNLGQQKADLEGQLGETAAQIARAYQVINEAQANLVKIESDRQNEIAQSLRDTESQIMQLSDRLESIDDQLARTDVKAPEAGVVVDLRIHTTGGVIGAGEPLLDLVPADDRLIVSARVRPEDINLVHPGLTAQVHLLPYNQRRVPLLAGQVGYVSADRLVDKQTGQPYYAATIQVTDERVTRTREVEMVPGMPAQALIETGQSSVALYMLRPLLDSFNRAFREN